MFKNENNYRLRKLTIGLVSVSAGLLFAVQTPKMAKADVVNTPQAQVETVAPKQKAPAVNVAEPTTTKQNIVQPAAKQASQPTQAVQTTTAQPTKPQNVQPTKPVQQLNNEEIQKNVQYKSTVNYDKQNAKSALIAGESTTKIDVHVDIDNGNPNITKLNPITVKVTNNGSFKDISVDKDVENAKDSPWSVNYVGNGTYNANYIGNKIPKTFDLDFDLMGDMTQITKKTTITPVVSVTLPNNKTNVTTLPSQTYVPFTEGIDQYSLIKGFRIGDTTIANESHWGNIGSEDLPYVLPYDKNAYVNANGQVVSLSSQKIYQYGIYFNYNKMLAKDLREYVWALFGAKFGGAQQLLPTTIKVFAVPDDLIGTKTDRIKIGDPLPAKYNMQGKSVYDYITSYNAGLEKSALEQVLRSYASAKDNTMSFEKKDAKNAFNDDTAYFVQVDTLGIKGEKPTFINWRFNGNGVVKPVTTPYYSESKATYDGNDDNKTQTIKPTKPNFPAQPENGGELIKNPAKPAQPTKPVQPTKSVEPTKPVHPTKPVQPTKSVEPTKPVHPTKPVQPTKSVEPTKPVQPTEPVQPTNPASPTEPVQQTKTVMNNQSSDFVPVKSVTPDKATKAPKAKKVTFDVKAPKPSVKKTAKNNSKLTIKRNNKKANKNNRKQAFTSYKDVAKRRERLANSKRLRLINMNVKEQHNNLHKFQPKADVIKNTQARLPQTGDKQKNEWSSIAGAFISFAGIMALLFAWDKHDHK